MSDDYITITVPTGASSEYQFRHTALGSVEVSTGSEHDHEFGLGHHYHTFEGKGKTAIIRLMESHQRLSQFFEAARKISSTRYPDGRLEGFMERDDVSSSSIEGAEDAWELVAEMIEEADRAEQARGERKEQDGRN